MKRNPEATIREKEVRKDGFRPKPRIFGNTDCQGMYFISNRSNKKEEQEKIKAKTVEIIGEALGAISNDSRANIAKYIRDKKDVKFEELRKEFNLNNNTLTFHLNKLQSAHIVSQQKDRGSYSLGKLGEVMLDYLEALESELSSKIEKILS